MQATVSPSSVASTSRVTLDASVSRPVIEISPRSITSATVSSTAAVSPTAASLTAASLTAALTCRSRGSDDAGSAGASAHSDARAAVAPVDAGSAEGTTVIAVQPRADVTLCVQRVVAQRAWRTAGGDHLLGMLGEVPGLTERQEHPQRVRAVLTVLQHDLLADLFLRQRQQFDDHLGALAVPGQAHRADAELRVDRCRQGEIGADAGGALG